MNWTTVVLLGIAIVLIFKAMGDITSMILNLSVKSIYIIMNSGVTLYYKNFTSDDDQKTYIDEFISGGFINALTSGLKKAINIKNTEIKKITIGNNTLLFTYSTYVIGLLLVSEITDPMIEYLSKLVSNFEEVYEDKLVHWSGDVSIFKKEDSEVNKLVNKVFS
jgi:hypothetical protein